MSSLPATQWSAFLDAAPDALVVSDAAGSIVFLNTAAEDLFGYPRDALDGQPIEVLLPERFREGHARYQQAFLMVPRRRPLAKGATLYGRRSDGTEFPAEISLSPVHTEQGTFVCSAIRDASQHVLNEQNLQHEKENAVQASRTKSEFLAAASHDLRQPLQTLSLLHGALVREIASASPTASEILTMQEHALRVMSDLLSSLLDISKLDAGAVRPHIVDYSLVPTFERLRSEFSPIARAKGLDLIVEPTAAVVRSDPALLAQIVQNLIANAIRYTSAGEVRLRCVPTESSAVSIEVIDTGIGIPEGEQQRIFEEFYQLPHSSGEREGLGLGLSIVRRTANLLGHPLEVESHVGAGSRFAVRVPGGLATQVRSARQPASARIGPHSRSSILVVDDDASIARASSVLLRAEGFRVGIASDCAQACAWVRENPEGPDVIVCDYHLGVKENGIDAIRAIRSVAGKNVPAILVTGDTSLAMAKAAGEIGRCTLLSKPVDTDALLERIAGSVRHPDPPPPALVTPERPPEGARATTEPAAVPSQTSIDVRTDDR